MNKVYFRKSVLMALLSLPLALPAWLQAAPAESSVLSWDRREAAIDVDAGESTAVAEFIATNISPRPVKIRDIAGSCHCIQGEIEPTVIAPGATARLSLKITLGDNTGVLRESVIVSTEPQSNPMRLKVSVTIPQFATFSEKEMIWHVNGQVAEKSVTVTVPDGIRGKIEAISSTSDRFVLTPQFDGERRSVTVRVKPAALQSPSLGFMRAQVRLSNGTIKSANIVLRIVYPDR